MCPGLFPGEPAEALAVIGGHGPLPSLTHPLWEGVVRLAEWWSPGDVVRALNVFNVVTGAVAAALLFHVAAIFRTGVSSKRSRPEPGSESEPRTSPTAGSMRLDALLPHLPPLLAVLLGAGSFPFLFVASRSHPTTLAAALWLAGLGLVAAYARTGRRVSLYAGAVWLGLATAESPGGWPLWPALLLWLVVAMVRHRDLVLPVMPDEYRGHLRLRTPIIAGTLALAALLAPWLVRAAIFHHEPAAAWAGADSYWDALLEVLRAQLRAARTTIPALGWLLPALCVGLPAAIVIAAFAGEHPDRRGPAAASLLLVSCISIAVAFDVPFAPWPVFGASPLLVTPYGVMALWTAAAAAGLIRLLLRDLDRRDLPGALSRIDLTPLRRRRAAAVYAIAMTGALVIATGRHVVQVARCDSAPFDEFAFGVLDELGDADRLVLATPLEPLITVRARHARPDARVLNLQVSRHPVYLRYVADVFADDPRARGLATAGLDAVLADWFARDPSVTGRVVIVDAPDAWRLGGWTALPGRWTYRGIAAPDAEHLRAHWAVVSSWTSHMARRFARLERLPPAFRPYAGWLRRHASRLLNDFGFLIEEAGLTDEALVVYETVATLDSEHYSARHNRARLTRQLGRPEADAAQMDLDRWIRARAATFHPLEAAHRSGRIRDPNLQMASSALAARAGFLDVALSELTEVLQQRRDDPSARLAMAAVLDRRGNSAESRAIFERLAADNPDRADLQLATGLAALTAGDITSAVAIARSLARLDPPPAALPTYEALIAVQTGDVASATAILNRRLADAPEDVAARLALGYIAAKTGDTAALRRTLGSVRSRNLSIPWLETLLAQALAVEGRTVEARERVEEIVARHPAFGPAWEILLALDVAERRADRARDHAARLLRLQPTHPRANYIWASLLMAESKWGEAEAALEIALRGAPTDTHILNDLAWCRLQLGRAESALELATRAVEREPDSPALLDTLARALLAVGHTNRAMEVARRVRALSPDHSDRLTLATNVPDAANAPR